LSIRIDGVDDDGCAQRAGYGLGDTAAGTKPQTLQVLEALDRTPGVEDMSGPVGENAEQVNALVFAGLMQALPVQAVVGNGGDLGCLPGAGKVGDQRQHVALRRVARADKRYVHQPVAHGVEGCGRRDGMLRQHPESQAARARLLQFVGKTLQHDARQMVSRRDPRRHRQRGLRTGAR